MATADIIFIGTSSFSVECLKFLRAEFNILAVITVPDSQKGRNLKTLSSDMKTYACENSLKIFTPSDLSDANFLQEIKNLKPEFFVLCDYGKILPKVFLEAFPKDSVNIHPSLLPLWRGAAPVERSLMNGDKRTGVSLQIVTEKLDAGDIIAQKSFPIKESHDAQDIYKQALKISEEFLTKDLPCFFKGEITATPQDEDQKTYAHKIDKKEAQLDWSQSAEINHNKVRALVLGPQAFSFFGDKNERLKIYKTEVVSQEGEPSKIIACNDKELVVACGSKALKILEVQRESRKKQNISEFLKGARLKVGQSFARINPCPS